MAKDFPKAVAPEILPPLVRLGSNRVFRKGEGLFHQGAPAQGVYIVERGRVSILLSPGPKGLQPTELVGPGAVLGLSECISGKEYRVSVEAIERTTISYIDRQELMAFLRGNCEICMHIVRLLSQDLHALYHKLRTIKGPASSDRRKAVRSLN